MYPHHERAIAQLTAELQADPTVLALLLGGSIAKGREQPESDVDFVLITTAEEFARRQASGELQYFSREATPWPGGYAEGKWLDLAFLAEVADHGSEPARAAFSHVRVLFSRVAGLDDLLARIPVYPEAARAAKMRAFYSQVDLLTWFVDEAEKRADPYLLSWATTHLTLFGGRLILAYNRILFPYHKWFTYELRRAPEQPPEFQARFDALLAHPDSATAHAFHACLTEWRDWGVDRRQAVVQFIFDTEWTWRDGRPALAELMRRPRAAAAA